MLPTWVFQRGTEHLLLHCRETPRGASLVVSGDTELRSYSFRDFDALVKFEEEMEQSLLQAGWEPAEMTIELKASPDPVSQPQSPRVPRTAI